MARRTEPRGSPRAALRLPCTLRRARGGPVPGRTLNVGTGGMLVCTERPLAVDEQVDFDLAGPHAHVEGHARVLRQERHDVYALRFEGLPDAASDRLRALVERDEPAG